MVFLGNSKESRPEGSQVQLLEMKVGVQPQNDSHSALLRAGPRKAHANRQHKTRLDLRPSDLSGFITEGRRRLVCRAAAEIDAQQTRVSEEGVVDTDSTEENEEKEEVDDGPPFIELEFQPVSLCPL
jgi:hypothetical protein